jgi:adenylate cyclase
MCAAARKLATILAADIAGYGRLVGVDEEGTLETLRALRRELIDPTIERHRGRVVKRTGDGILIEFVSVVDAVRCAMAVQQAMVTRNAGIPSARRIEFRVGINLGDIVVEEDGDLMGDGVNIAARLEGIADPGGIMLSDDAWRQARGKVTVEAVDLGERRLKNIELPVRVYGISPAASEAPAAPAASPRPHPPLPDKPSIAVLPFLNLTGNPDQEYFADAITEDIVTALSRWHWFFVIARNSSFAYKNRAVDVKQIGRELGVRYVLEGSVQRSATRVRATGQLIDSATAAHIWADTIDRDIADIFALQDAITEQVVTAIEPAMLQSEGARIVRKNPKDLTAFDCFQRGMWQFNKMSQPTWHEALALFREAVARDPELALGHSGVARALYTGVAYAWTTAPDRDLAEAEEAAQTAIRLDARDAYGHFALSGTLLYLGRHQEALDEAGRTIALNPNFAFGHFRLGQVLTYSGRAAEAVSPIERSMRHSPYDPQLGAMLTQLALAHYQAHNYPEAQRHAQSAIILRHPTAYAVAAASLARLGRTDEARAAITAFLPGFQQQLASRTLRLVPYANAADQAHLFDGLRLAGLEKAMLDAAR